MKRFIINTLNLRLIDNVYPIPLFQFSAKIRQSLVGWLGGRGGVN